MDDYLMKAEGVLGDEHSFVRLVDTMPSVRFCDHYPDEPEGRDEVESWDEIQHCHRAGVLEYHNVFGTGGLFCEEHLPEKAPHPSAKGSYEQGLTEHVTAAGDQRIVDAARVSIAGENVRPTSDDRKLIRYLVKHRHTSPLEQVVLTFHMRMPIFIARQIVRHRTARLNEESARYGQLAGDFYVPPLERMNPQHKSNKQGSKHSETVENAEELRGMIAKHSQDSYHLYEHLLGEGLARELARMVLPLNVYTQWFWQMDLHNLFHFLTLRTHAHAQKENALYALPMIEMARAVAPYATEAWEEHRERWAKAMKL